MLPTRSRLQGWNPETLSAAGDRLTGAGRSVYDAVVRLDDEIDRMPEARGWEGQAHAAAVAMFRRGADSASTFATYTENIGAALKSGADRIGSARRALLNYADEVDRGDLRVTDLWVVVVKPVTVSAERAAELEHRAAETQVEVNRLLADLGEADDTTAADLRAVAAQHGFEPPAPGLDPLMGRPADEVPNPSSTLGLMQQRMLHDHESAQTVRETRQWTTEDGQHRTTVFMMDGSRHEIYRWNPDAPAMSDSYYDRQGNLVSTYFMQDKRNVDGTTMTVLDFSDGTTVRIDCDADGVCSSEVTTADGRYGVLPDEFFTHPVPTLVGGALTGLEYRAKAGIPLLSAAVVDDIGRVGKYGGPALGVAVGVYDFFTADTLQDACVAAFAASGSVVGGYFGGPAGVMVASAAGVPFLAPAFAAGGSVAGSWTFGYIGGTIGNLVCR